MEMNKKKHYKQHRKQSQGNDEESKKKKHHHKGVLKDSFKDELNDMEAMYADNLLPEIFPSQVKKKSIVSSNTSSKFGNIVSSQIKKQRRESKKDLKSLVESASKKGSVGKITKIKDKNNASFGILPKVNRIQLTKTQPKEVSIGDLGSSLGSSDHSITPHGAPHIVLSHRHSGTGRSRTSSQDSKGGHGTPDEDNYDTEELRVLNHQKMVHLLNKKTNPMVRKWKQWIASMDTFAAKHTSAFHNMCIKMSFTMVPILLLSLIWDWCAGYILEIPQYSMINHPGFMLVFHFISLPTVMYGYMMRSLMGKSKTTLSRLAVAAMIIHPVLLGSRCYMEWEYNEYRDEEKLHYEWFRHHENFDEESHNHWKFEFYD